VPRVRRKTEPPAALAAQGFGAPKLHEQGAKSGEEPPAADVTAAGPDHPAGGAADVEPDEASQKTSQGVDEGPVHRRLIRASLPRTEGQAPPTRPNPEFTIRQPNNNRQNRFRPRHGGGGRGPMQMNGNGNGNSNRPVGGGYPQRQHGGGNPSRRHGGGGRNRSK